MNHFFNKKERRSGATLLLTLGILTVISILTATFLLTARLQKKTTVTIRNRNSAEKALPIALSMAMRQIEESLSYPNYTDETMQFNGETEEHQRLAPINRWFSEEYVKTNKIDENITFQKGPVMTSPTVEGYSSINLLTPEALSYIPAVLTNGLPLDASNPKPLRSGWIPTDILKNLLPDISVDYRLQSKPSRIAFAIFDCSGTIDANVFPQSPTQKKKQKKYYAQSDVAAIVEESSSDIRSFIESNNVSIAEIEHKEPFFHTSYDPDPNTFRFHSGSGNDILGNGNFTFNQPLNLNTPGIYQAITALTSGNMAYNKFNINSITNTLQKYSSKSILPWQDDFQLITDWFIPTRFISEICRNTDKHNQSLTFDDGKHIAWSVANFIDEDRIPEVSHFIEYEMPTRSNFAVEDVPLISKISIFNIDDGAGNNDYIGPADKLKNYDYYDMDPNLSNHYAVAVELWYPFAPNSPYGSSSDTPQLDPACYIGIYTNESEVSTTTNRAPTVSELENFFGTNVIMKVLFETWAREYEKEVGWEYLDGNPIWQKIRNIGDYWFTPATVNNPLWKETTGQGEEWFTVVITNSPLYNTFYPETYSIVSTNETGDITTNSYTYITQTNHWLNITYPGQTNEFIYSQYIDDENYMVMYWEDSETGAITNSLLGGIVDENGNIVDLNYTNNIATSIIYGNATNENYMISENAETGIITTNLIAAILMSPDTDEPLFTTYSNIYNQYTVAQVTPLVIPPEFEEALNELFLMLPTNSISAMHDFMLLTTDDIKDLNKWDELLDYFSNSPGIKNTIIPHIIEPSLGNLTKKDKYWLAPEKMDNETTTVSEPGPENANGFFWTVYPKKTVSFLEITERIPPGAPPDSDELEVVTNCYALGAYMSGKQNKMWIRPVTTVVGTDIMAQVGLEENERPSTDRVVDEAVMLAKDNDYNNDTVRGWSSVTNIYVADPRDNSYANRWLPFSTEWDSEVNTPKLHTGVKELPFIHYDAPLNSIGDLGYIYTEYRRWNKNESSLTEITGNGSAQTQNSEYNPKKITPEEEPADTIDFFNAAGASLLDFFTLKPNKPERGLIQANTTLKPTLDILFSDVMVGWTNGWSSGSDTYKKLSSNNQWPKLWCEALTNNLYNTGWRCFADMLPDLSTNKMHETVDVNGIPNAVDKHNYTEDVLRGIIDKVSFRQNVYFIVLAAQVVDPGTKKNVLAEQRAAVTVIRDAYSGNWTISDWIKLTQ